MILVKFSPEAFYFLSQFFVHFPVKEFAHSKPSNFIIIMRENAINYREIIENSARYSDVQLQVGTTFLNDLGFW